MITLFFIAVIIYLEWNQIHGLDIAVQDGIIHFAAVRNEQERNEVLIPHPDVD
jgi:hypothetical protein